LFKYYAVAKSKRAFQDFTTTFSAFIDVETFSAFIDVEKTAAWLTRGFLHQKRNKTEF